MNWKLSHRADPRANIVAKRHYTCQTPDSDQFMPPGSCCVFAVEEPGQYAYAAVWGTSFPKPEFVMHAWRGAWVCSIFHNRSGLLSSDLILEAVAATRAFYGPPPGLGMVTFVHPGKTRRRRSKNSPPGKCFVEAGFRQAICPDHMIKVDDCKACNGFTKGGLVALQFLPDAMPEPLAPFTAQRSLLEEVA